MGKAPSERLSLTDLEKLFRQKQFAPIYYFWGEEDLQIEQAIDLIIKYALDESMISFNLDIVGSEKVDAKDIVSLASAFPMMADRRVVIVKNLDMVEKPELLLSIIEKPVQSTILAIAGGKLDMRLKLSKAIQTNGVVVEFRQLYDNEVPIWISKKISERGKSANMDACNLIQTYVGKSLREIQNEIDKLFIYVGAKPAIEVSDVSAVVGISKKYNIFELQKAIGRKDIAASLEVSEKMLDAGEYPVGMIVMLTKYFERLWTIRDFIEGKISKDELIKNLRMNPRQLPFLEEDIKIARSFSSSEIERCFAILLDVDEKLKSTDTNPKLLFTIMLYNFINSKMLFR